jgi:hypothetical protein
MSMLDRLEHNLEDAIAEQQAGRVTREQCVEAMAKAAFGKNFHWDHTVEETKVLWRLEASRALDAAITSGYVVVNK